ncbi:ubiquinone biosynthesis hydroxylase family protein [Oryzomicrobium terrae]|uniref:Ubiquinone biosynthesis hydroxylase family protein n=1 Tax=Oryzomicrobium terrae TaxID=1735038 RepID=A0A5C1E4W4_9RHOO|nr:UbiH/UbiF family hydroxylase [Oryzomicrobium terrae]QEL63913.1 ubiquinone biosynthesis hydroxylase family protein [Oryzomicrobium terrae]
MSQEKSPDFDVLIVGGGLAGLSLAVGLRDARLKVALVEAQPPRRPTEGWDARIYAVSPANARFLRQLGVWDRLDLTRVAPVERMAVAGDAGGQLDFSAYEAGVPELAWIAESSLIADELWQTALRQANLTLYSPARPAAVRWNEQAAHLTLDDGRALSARLLVAADGRDSWLRGQAGLPAHTTPYNEVGVVANFDISRPHLGVAHQWFRDDGVLAYLPLPGDRMSIVWSTPDAHAKELLALEPAAFCDTVAAAGGRVLGELSLITPPVGFPLRLIRVPRTVAPRLALLGDAAHGIHPLSGHGINLGFQDARALAELLSGASPWQDVGDERFLARYQRARKEEVVMLQTVTDGLRRLFREPMPLLRAVRNAGMSLTNRLGPVKSSLIRYALET